MPDGERHDSNESDKEDDKEESGSGNSDEEEEEKDSKKFASNCYYLPIRVCRSHRRLVARIREMERTIKFQIVIQKKLFLSFFNFLITTYMKNK